MKIKTLGNRIQLVIDTSTAGDLSLESMVTAKEVGTVIGIGKDVTLPIKIGDKVLFKAWAVDIISDNGEKYYFIAQNTNGICGIVVK